MGADDQRAQATRMVALLARLVTDQDYPEMLAEMDSGGDAEIARLASEYAFITALAEEYGETEDEAMLRCIHGAMVHDMVDPARFRELMQASE